MKCITKFLKKQRLLDKYRLTNKKMLDDLYLAKLMRDDKEFMIYFAHFRACEIRCYRRLKAL